MPFACAIVLPCWKRGDTGKMRAKSSLAMTGLVPGQDAVQNAMKKATPECGLANLAPRTRQTENH